MNNKASLRTPGPCTLPNRRNMSHPLATERPRRRFRVVLIKPSHYHDDGYVIRWWRGLVPSNSLAALHGVALDCAQRRVLGDDVDIEIDVIDETNTRVNVARLLRRFKKDGGFGLVGLIGVQTNQYPRALDIARPFRAAGVAGRDRRLSRLRLHRHARRHRGRSRSAPARSASAFLPARRKGDSRRCCMKRPAARSSRTTISPTTLST